MVAASASERIQIDTQIVLSHRLDQQLVLLVLIAPPVGLTIAGSSITAALIAAR